MSNRFDNPKWLQLTTVVENLTNKKQNSHIVSNRWNLSDDISQKVCSIEFIRPVCVSKLRTRKKDIRTTVHKYAQTTPSVEKVALFSTENFIKTPARAIIYNIVENFYLETSLINCKFISVKSTFSSILDCTANTAKSYIFKKKV
jgi:hypothetical protein